MNERLLQYIWQFQYYNANKLTTTDGLALQIVFAGIYNVHQGPDFYDARIWIDGTLWIGRVELHIRTSDWERHKHQHDRQYDNVILHVVWEDDNIVNNIPVLVLEGRVPQVLLSRYEELMYSPQFIPCGVRMASVREIIMIGWKERLLLERLSRKADHVYDLLAQNQNHWEETCWWMIARNFGLHVNSDSFQAIARSIPLRLVSKHRHQSVMVEAILFGQAGLLGPSFTDDYALELATAYTHAKKMYRLQNVHQPLLFLRMRPSNFPTIRLSQLSALIISRPHLFNAIKEITELNDLIKLFEVRAAGYWDTHYRFDKISVDKEKKLGASMIVNIIINTVAPLLFAYGERNADATYKEKAIRWLTELNAEDSRITRGFKSVGVVAINAADSQALLELKTSYCDQKRCLDCSIGYWLLSNS